MQLARNIGVCMQQQQIVSAERALDDELVRRAQAGDQSAFGLLVRKYQTRVISIVGRLVRDRTECEDISQEVFIRAFRALGNFRGDSGFYTWIFKIAINTARNWLAANGRTVPLTDIDQEVADHMDDAARLRDRDTPEKEALRDEIEREVFATIAELPDDIREAITLREIKGLSYEDIAAKMQCPIGTVRSRIFRARDAIDRRLRPLMEPSL
jgi:RNA polymerase sigma-70 factor, ECF subfamily